MAENSDNNAYWAANIRLVTICLVIWALASYGFAILLRPLISGIAVGGTDLGFWFAQQGSILVFLFLIFFYAFRMNCDRQAAWRGRVRDRPNHGSDNTQPYRRGAVVCALLRYRDLGPCGFHI
jgi:putative solute:sodium symporter small subunit